MNKVLLCVVVAGCGSSEKAALPTKSVAPTTAAALTPHPAMIDTKTFAELVNAQTDWSTYISPIYGVAVVSARDKATRRCGDDAVAVVRETVGRMKGATCDQYESDGVACSFGDLSIRFDKEDVTWELYAILQIPRAALTSDDEGTLAQHIQRSPECSL